MQVIFRAEPGYLIAYRQNQKLVIMGKHLEEFMLWLDKEVSTDFIEQMYKYGYLEGWRADTDPEYLRQLVRQCQEIQAPLRSMYVPEIMNLELTTRCPLRCPQCYCDLYQGKDLDKEVALYYLEQAVQLKIPYINLSGGETLVYPYLDELLAFTHKHGLSSAIAISGWGFDRARFHSLKQAGVADIYVSLNGSTREINALSRDAYDEAIQALQLLQSENYDRYYLNWVARADNVDDFPKVVELAIHYGVKGIVILESKPDSAYQLQSVLSPEQFVQLARYIKAHDQSQIPLVVEPCFSALRAYINNYFFFNKNIGVDKGCGAGRNAMAVDVDGNLIPCRHMPYPEKYEQIEDYWRQSPLLDKLRRFEDKRSEPCHTCYLKNNCISCRAVADKVDKDIFSGNKYCPVGGIST